MFFTLKKKLMAGAIAKRNLEHPFDFAAAEKYTLDANADPLVNNSYYFSAHNTHLSFFARLGKRVNQEETWFVVYVGGKLYSLKQEVFPAGASPLHVENKDGKWTVSYEGILNEKDQIRFRGTFMARQAPIDFTSHMPAWPTRNGARPFSQSSRPSAGSATMSRKVSWRAPLP